MVTVTPHLSNSYGNFVNELFLHLLIKQKLDFTTNAS